MEQKKLFQRYAYFFEVLQRMGDLSLYKDVKIKDLNMPKGMMKVGYNELAKLKEEGFPGDLIDYLSVLSSAYIIAEWKKQSEEAYLNSKFTPVIAKDLFENLWLVMARNLKDGRNAVRLFNKNPSYFLDGFQISNEKLFKKLNKRHTLFFRLGIFHAMSALNCIEYHKEYEFSLIENMLLKVIWDKFVNKAFNEI